ncbi:MAG: ABC transporter ATP-binding protein/permease [Spirochaetaceae bacterium]|jgi:ATP-binding cassette subfamily B protein|nr:ABC transporter ATP-binding protein/permease [Spirochaetaceae bacterium]
MAAEDFRNKSSISLFAAYYRPHWKLFTADMFCASLIAGVDLIFPLMTKLTIERFLPTELYRFFFIMIILMVLLYILRTGFSYFVTYWGHTVGAYIEADMRRDLFNHLQKLPFSFYDNHRTGHIMSRVTNDLFEVTELAHHGPEDLFISLLTLLGAFFLIFFIRWEMAVVLFVMIPFMVIHTILSRINMLRASKKVKERTAEINASLESSISGARVAKAFTNETHETEKFTRGNEYFKSAKKTYYRSMALFNSKLEFLMYLLNVAVIAVGGYLIMRHKMTLAELITCNLFVAAFLQPIRRLASFVEQYTTGMAGFSRFVDIMRIEPDIQDKPGAVTMEGIRGRIEYRDVTFSYNHDIRVLEHINLFIPEGTTLALVGPSGGGKTTLCHLLPRFYEIREGSITIDGRDIRDVTLESLRKSIGIVQQDVFLFAGTIEDNIRYGRLDADREEIIQAAKRAEIHDDIIKMSAGYDTIVGERGVKLSGGQKQRISIARIFLKNPPILILDEATSALDSATELKIQHALEELSRGRTTLVIAHRLSTIRSADRIVVIDDVGIRQQGSHGDLMTQGGLYSELYTAQFTHNKDSA